MPAERRGRWPVERAVDQRQAERVDDRASASSAPTRLAPDRDALRRRRRSVDALAHRRRGEADVGVDARRSPRPAPAPPAARCRARRSASLPSTGARAVLGDARRSAGSARRRPRGPETAPALARDRDVAAEPHHQSVEGAVAARVPVTSAAVDLAGEADARAGQVARRSARPRGRRRRASPRSAGPRRWRWPEAVSRPPSARVDEREVGERRLEADVGARASRSGRWRRSSSCGFSSRRFSVRKPVSSRTARPESVVSPASSAVEPRRRRGRGRWRCRRR